MAKRSIIFLIEPGVLGQQCVGRALMMARYLRARLDIVLCSDQSGYVPTPARAQREAEREQQYLDSLCKTIIAPDVEISSETNSGSPGEVARRAGERACEMVVMQRGSTTDALRRELALLRVCPVPVLLTRGRAWHPQPRFAAAIDSVPSAPEEPADSVLRAASGLRLACAAELDLICVGSGALPTEPAEHQGVAYPQLAQLGRKFGIGADHLHVLDGDGGRALPQLLAKHDYDLLVIAASGPEGLDIIGRGALVSERASEDDDLLIVQDRNEDSQPAFSKSERFNWSTAPLWSWLGAD